MPRKKNEPFIFLTVVLILGILGSCASASAQDIRLLSDSLKIPLVDSSRIEDSIKCNPVDSLEQSSETPSADSIVIEPIPYSPGADTVLINAYMTRDTLNPRPPGATQILLKSVLFPGGGQFDNGKYIKAVAVFATETWLIYQALRYNRRTSEWRQLWKNAEQSPYPSARAIPITFLSSQSVASSTSQSDYFRKYTSNRDTRNSYIWYTALTVFVSMFDAYVDAQLRDFPKKNPGQDRLSLDVVPGEETRLALRYNF